MTSGAPTGSILDRSRVQWTVCACSAVAFCLMACLVRAQGSAPTDIQWRFDEGQGRRCQSEPASPSAGKMNASWATGTFGTCIYLTGERRKTVVFGDVPGARLGTGSFTVSCWVLPESLPKSDGGCSRLLGKVGFPKTFWTLDFRREGMVGFGMRDHNGKTGNTISEGRIACGKWSLITVVVDRDAQNVSYVFNGKLDSVRPYNKAMTGNLDVIGSPLATPASRLAYVGLFDTLRIERRALKIDDIQARYATEKRQRMSAEFEETPVEIQRFPVPPPEGKRQQIWDMARLGQIPETSAAGDIEGIEEAPGIRALFYEGVPYQGKVTHVFAWLGVPEHTGGETVPGMVLIHGGGGTAFKSWVELWMERGYAAIAMDTCGHVPIRPEGAKKGWIRHSRHPGPVGWGGFDQINEPIADQWAYHAVSSAVLGHTLLRSIPDVDEGRVGLTGISWGGYLTNIVAGVDSRFRFAAPVYGCGFLGENSSWLENRLQNLAAEDSEKWVRLWDPARYVGFTALPMLFCNGTNDIHYRMDSWQKTYRTVKRERTLCCKVRMPHGHPPAGDPPEISAYADAILKSGTPLPRITDQGTDGRTIWATFDPAVPVVSAALNVTRDAGRWERRHWDALPVPVDSESRRVSASLPGGVTAAFLNLFDSRGLIVSTEHVTLP